MLQLYTVLMVALAPVLWLMLRRPNLTMAASVALYFAARQFDWNLSSFPDGTWYFNPFCWQLLFVFGARLALGRAPDTYPVLRSPLWLYLAVAYLLFALVMTLAGRFPSLGIMFPAWLVDTFNPERQGQSGAVSRAALRRRRVRHHAIYPEGLARLAMAGVRSADQMR